MKKVLVAFLVLFPMTVFADGRPPFKPGEVIVKYKIDRSSRGATIQMASQAMEEAQSEGYRVAHYHYGLNISQMKVPASKTVEKAIEEISAIEGVEYVEPNYRVYFNALGVEKIEEIDLGKWLQPSSPTSLSNPTVIVAVIDTGVDYTHEGLNPSMWVNRGEVPQNGIDDDRNGFVDDYYGYNFIANNGDPMDDNYHGTHVAGIIVKTLAEAESADPSAAGLRSAVGIMALKFLNKDGEGYVSDAIRAVSYAISMGAKVLNNSWGGGNFSRALQDAISQTYYNNRLFVVASGNDAKNIDQFPSFPASYTHPHLVSVAALDSFNSYGLAWFSNFGKQSVDVGAPGVSIRSTLPNNRYGSASGTSMATPFVSAVGAAIWVANPSLNHLQVKEIMMRSADGVTSLKDLIVSPGIADTLSAIEIAKQTSGNPSIPPLVLPNPPQESVGYYDGSDYFSNDPSGCALMPWVSNGPFSKPPGPDYLLILLPIIILLMARFRPIRQVVRIWRRSNQS